MSWVDKPICGASWRKGVLFFGGDRGHQCSLCTPLKERHSDWGLNSGLTFLSAPEVPRQTWWDSDWHELMHIKDSIYNCGTECRYFLFNKQDLDPYFRISRVCVWERGSMVIWVFFTWHNLIVRGSFLQERSNTGRLMKQTASMWGFSMSQTRPFKAEQLNLKLYKRSCCFQYLMINAVYTPPPPLRQLDR